MKKIFTLACMALFAMGVNAQDLKTVKVDCNSDEIQAKMQASMENPVKNNNADVIAVDEDHYFPTGTYEACLESGDWSVVTKSEFAGPMNDYVWKYESEAIDLTAVSTINLDNKATEAWQKSFNAAENLVLNVEGYPKFELAWKAKAGNPDVAFITFYDVKTAEPLKLNLRLVETIWEPTLGKAPAKGLYYKFTTKVAGEFVAGVYINRNTPFYIYNATDNKIVTAATFKYYVGNNTEPLQTIETLPEDGIISTAGVQLGYVKFNAEAGKDYYVMCPKFQLGLYGFEYTYDAATGISEITAASNDNAPVYNLAGQKVGNDYKGIVIKNGKKFVNK